MDKRNDHTHYMIIPHFISNEDQAGEILNCIPKEKLILLDKLMPGVDGEFGAVYENFEKDIYNALSMALNELRKYHTLKLIFPAQSYYPYDIIKGFRLFCQQYAFFHEVINDVIDMQLAKGEVYINLIEEDLVILLERLVSIGLKPGVDVGVISYNETPFKKIILNGISTISTDFQYMGEAAADMILSNVNTKVHISFHYTRRASL